MTLADRLAALKPEPAKVLTLDIETSPATAYVWGLRDQNIGVNQLIAPQRTLCFAAKWLDGSMVFHSEWTDGADEMIAAAWRLLDEADLVVGYNHVRFDIPHLQREMVERGYGPPSPWIDVDLLPAIRRRFRFMSNKLGAVTESLGLDTKDDPGGFSTWTGVLAGDPSARARMREYNVQDVAVTEDLFVYLRPWLKLPHAGLFNGRMHDCAACGSAALTPDGISRTPTTAWLRLVCECGAHNRVLANGETRLA